MTADGGGNRLAEEESPYLRQHADNPVDWQPWDEAALAEARERDVPIFLSIGYSACHWCHVMEEESFADEAVAEVLNDDFVPIKVDREERPDLDSIYMTVCQLVTGRGGWPLSAWLTPEGKPFYVGTYFPREAKRGSPGFLDLLEDIAESWTESRDEIEARADEWTAALVDRLEETPEAAAEPPDAEVLEAAADAVLRSADREHGGFNRSGPKFPQPPRIDLLLATHAVTGRDDAREVAVGTLDAMAAGGMYDQIGGGFHRYATDREWTVPHFEKMLYDNAELSRVYLQAHRLTGASRYATVAQESLAFVERELSHPEGGFYSTLDARSRPPASRGGGAPTEGAFYVWTPGEVEAAVDDDLTATLVKERYGVTAGGNFERGTTVPTVAASYADLAETRDLSADEVRDRLVDARTDLFEARSERPRPPRDEKVLAGWNGLAISAFALGGRVLDPGLTDRATTALSFVRDRLWDADEGRLRRRYKDGDVKVDGYLEDYAFLARGAFDCYGATGDSDHLAFALDLAREIHARFWDPDAGTLYFTEAGEEDGDGAGGLVTRPQEFRDQSTPSSLGVATRLLLDLDAFAPDAGFGDAAERVLRTHADRIRGGPTEHVSLALAAHRHARGGVELVFAADDVPDAWRTALAERYIPTEVLAPRPPTEDGMEVWLDGLGLDEVPPLWRGRIARDGPTVYACRGRACSPPSDDLDDALDWLEGQ
ncbi:MAG: thioredoxin domain-containing protein [Haloferacaceae archaeon]